MPVKLLRFGVERYKGYAELAEVELAPLTILVGSNNSGKTALAQAIQLLAGGLVPSDKDSPEPLPLESGGILHGRTFEDLLTDRTAHGHLMLSANFTNDNGDLSLSATVQNVLSPPKKPVRQVTKWSLSTERNSITLAREGLDERSAYQASTMEGDQYSQEVGWQGLVPRQSEKLPTWIFTQAYKLMAWARGVRHLRCPRRLRTSPFTLVDESSGRLGPRGQGAPLALAADDRLRESVRAWYRKTFGVDVDVVAQGRYFDLVAGTTRYGNVPLVQSGRGLSHVLPVVVTALTARSEGPGVDVIEHPEAELHPASHAHITELLLENLVGPARPMVIETHSDMVLLRARRWIAEGRLPPDHVLVYWVYAESQRGSLIRKIRISESGEMESWPEGVFIEDYEEIMAIRRAARAAR